MTLFLVRHAKAKTGPGKRYIGHTDLPLSQKGRIQARNLAAYFKHIPLSSIVSSDLDRARTTAGIVAEFHAVPVETRKNLKEIHLGEWENIPFEEIKHRYPDQFQARGQNMDTFRPPDGESFQDLYNRVIPEFERLVHTLPQNILIVAHAGVIRVILCHLLGMPLKNIFRISQDHAAVNILSCHDGQIHIQRLNICVDLT